MPAAAERPRAASMSRADRVTDELRQAILSQEFPPGVRLAAEALAERFSVSATPLREAFARLAGEGLVIALPQRGVRVTDISVAEMEEVYELRELLEPIAIRRSVEAGKPQWTDRIRELHRRMQDAGGTDIGSLDGADYVAYEEIHLEFHKETMSRCGSEWLIRLTSLLMDHSRRFRKTSLPIRAKYGSVADEHAAIAAACLNLDADGAVAAHLAHVENTRKAIREWAEASGGMR